MELSLENFLELRKEIYNYINNIKIDKINILNEDCSTSKASYGWRS